MKKIVNKTFNVPWKQPADTVFVIDWRKHNKVQNDKKRNFTAAPALTMKPTT